MIDDAPSYHDLHITVPGVERTAISRLPYGVEVICNRVSGWQVWRGSPWELLGGEYDGPERWLVLDVAGHVIVDSRDRNPA